MLIIIIIPSMTIVPTTRWYGDACMYAPLRHYCNYKEVGPDPTHVLGSTVACPRAVAGNVRLLTVKARYIFCVPLLTTESQRGWSQICIKFWLEIL